VGFHAPGLIPAAALKGRKGGQIPSNTDPSGRAASSRGDGRLSLAGAMIADDHQSNGYM